MNACPLCGGPIGLAIGPVRGRGGRVVTSFAYCLGCPLASEVTPAGRLIDLGNLFVVQDGDEPDPADPRFTIIVTPTPFNERSES